MARRMYAGVAAVLLGGLPRRRRPAVLRSRLRRERPPLRPLARADRGAPGCHRAVRGARPVLRHAPRHRVRLQGRRRARGRPDALRVLRRSTRSRRPATTRPTTRPAARSTRGCSRSRSTAADR